MYKRKLYPHVFACYFSSKKETKKSNSTYRGVTVSLKNNWRKSCAIAKSQAKCGAISQMKPRNRWLEKNRKNTARDTFSTKNTLITTDEEKKRRKKKQKKT